MPDLSGLLENDFHLCPLLKTYIEIYNSRFSEKTIEDLHDVMLDTPEGNLATYQLDVSATAGRSGAFNIREGYIRALIHCLETGSRPNKIKVISIINHEQTHWTSSVCEIELNDGFIDFIEKAELENILKTDDFTLIGASNIEIKHYDSADPNPKEEGWYYYKQYKETLCALYEQNPVIMMPGRCVKQSGNTCGDHSVWNSFIAGVLGIEIDEEWPIEINSEMLRAYTESIVVPFFQSDEDRIKAEETVKKIEENMDHSWKLYQLTRDQEENKSSMKRRFF